MRMQVLADRAPGHIEGALAVARAALDAREFGAAREALAPYLSSPTRRVAELMAAIEQTEHGDEGRVREWMSRAMRAAGDPAWTADGVVSDQWRPVSPNGRLDGYQWRVPLAEIGVVRPVIELDVPPPPPAARRAAGCDRDRIACARVDAAGAGRGDRAGSKAGARNYCPSPHRNRLRLSR